MCILYGRYGYTAGIKSAKFYAQFGVYGDYYGKWKNIEVYLDDIKVCLDLLKNLIIVMYVKHKVYLEKNFLLMDILSWRNSHLPPNNLCPKTESPHGNVRVVYLV